MSSLQAHLVHLLSNHGEHDGSAEITLGLDSQDTASRLKLGSVCLIVVLLLAGAAKSNINTKDGESASILLDLVVLSVKCLPGLAVKLDSVLQARADEHTNGLNNLVGADGGGGINSGKLAAIARYVPGG